MDIKKRYGIELNKLYNHIEALRRGHIYELTHTPGTPSYTTLAEHLEEDIDELVRKIENDEPSVIEKAAKGAKNI